MIHEEQVYELQVGKAQQLVDAYEQEGVAILERILGRLVAFWSVEVGGSMDEVVQIWAYDGDDERRARREALWRDPEWLDFAARYGHLITRRSTRILRPATFSPAR